RLADPAQQDHEVGIERFHRRALGPRLDELGVRRQAPGGPDSYQVGGIDHRLALPAGDRFHYVGDGSARDSQQHHGRVRNVATIAAPSAYFVSGSGPEISESTTDASSTDARDSHGGHYG